VAVVVADLPGRDFLAPILGVPLVVHAVRGLLASRVVDHVTLLVRPDAGDAIVPLVAGLPVSVHAGPRSEAAAVVERVRSDTDRRPGTPSGHGPGAVLLHDATRPLTPPALAVAVTQAVAAGHAVAVPVLPVSDTVKHVDAVGLVVGSPDRTGLRVVQTPQAFRPDLLAPDVLHRVLVSGVPVEQAWAVAGVSAVTVPGHPLALSVCSAWERELAEVLA
jgi:2-C-methyl-D-erythritol 4-phosphate cytidylyltransferase